MSVITVYKKEAWYDLISAWRTPGFVLPALLFPVVFYLFFGVMLAGANNAVTYWSPMAVLALWDLRCLTLP